MTTKPHILKFRWAIKQLSSTSVEVLAGPNGMPLLHEAFSTTLTDTERDEAEAHLIQTFAVVKQ